jgi:hypothetical protein
MAAMPFELPDIWTAGGLVLALIGIGAAMTSVPGPSHWEFRVARICFGAAALLFLVKTAMWGAEELTPIRIILVALAGAAISVGFAFGIQWVNSKQAALTTSSPDRTAQPSADLEIRFKPASPYEVSEISRGHGLSTIKIGLKAVGKTFSNCQIYIEKMAPAPPMPGGFPILLLDNAPMLRPDDPETLIRVASKWDHVGKYRFTAPLPPMDSSSWYIDDNPPRLVEIKVTARYDAGDFQKTALFRIRVDESKKLHLERQ